MKILELTFWLIGATLLLLAAGAETWGEVERQRDVAAFSEYRQARAANVANALPAINASLMPVTGSSALQSPGESVLAILRIPDIELEVPVSYGTDEGVLLRGAGLVEGTALPGSNGNVAIAAHRDSYFRALKELALGDRIELESPDRTQVYVVTSLTVVEPTDVHVLADTEEPVLTLVTCYPFYFVGAAPQRFIVRAAAAEYAI
jgi:sortase A